MLNAKLKFSVKRRKVSAFSLQPSASARSAFTLVEVLVVMVLLLLIVLALMAVFTSTQTAFRASVTQAGVLEEGRAAMDLIAADLRTMSPSNGTTNGAANFYASVTTFSSPPSPLIQPLVGGGAQRVNVLETFFILGRGNQGGVPTWFGTGYAVTGTNTPAGPLYSLYRYSTSHPVAAVDPGYLFNEYFTNFLTGITNGSHLLDGVVDLTVRAYAPDGSLMTAPVQTNYYGAESNIVVNPNVWFLPAYSNYVGFAMFSNTLPAAVEVEMGVLEDRTLMRAESIPNAAAQATYLVNAGGQVHVFRQRVLIPNVDPSAYQ